MNHSENFRQHVTRVALANGFSLKAQPDGGMALNPYVFGFAKALLDPVEGENERMRKALWDIGGAAIEHLPFEVAHEGQEAAAAQNVVDAIARAGARLQEKTDDGQRLAFLLKRLSGHALREAVGEMGDTSDLAAFRALVDEAMQKQGFQEAS